MYGALLYLRLTSAKNWTLSRVRRLRQPRYLLGALAGAAYFWFFLIHRVGGNPRQLAGPGTGLSGEDALLAPALFLFCALAVFAILRIVVAWLALVPQPGLEFSEAEIAFPVPGAGFARTLVHFKLISTQLTILLSSVILALITGRGSSIGGNAFIHGAGWWLMISVVSLHTIGANFTVARLVAGGVSPLRRRAAVFGVIGLLLAAIGYTAWRQAPSLTEAALVSPAALLGYVRSVTDTGLLHWLLLPFRWLLGPFFAAGWAEFFRALGPALLLVGAHYLWVVRSQTSFEEASIALAEKRSRYLADRAAGGRRFGGAPTKARPGPFVLASSGGRPEVAFLWKNLLSTSTLLRPRSFAIAASGIVAGMAWLLRDPAGHRPALVFVSMLASISTIYLLLLGPQFARQDLRSDLGNVDILKTYPLRGWQVMLGELLTPTAILTGVLWLGLLAAVLALNPSPIRQPWLTPGFRLTAGACLALVMPLVCLLQLMVPNAATLLFPSWAQATRQRERGIEVMGQRLIFVFGQVVVIAVALLPAVLAGVLLWFAAHWIFGEAISTAFATAGVALILLAEVSLGLWWLGGRFERLDLSSETLK